MKTVRAITSAAAALAVSMAIAGGAQAAVIAVLPGDVGTSPVLNQWYLTNLRTTPTYTSTTTAAITGVNPRSGNGSVQMSLTDGSGKADYQYAWGFVSGRTLGNLNTLSYDWYRSGTSTNPATQQPAFRLLFDTDGSEATTNDRGYLVWEQTYQASPTVLVDQWVSSNLMPGDFWQRRFSPGTTIEQFDTDLSEWIAGANYAGGLVLSANTAILAIEFGIGSGWNGAFNGFVDNVSYRFGTEAVTTFNFELPNGTVPEPATIALVGISLLGLAARRRRLA